MNPLDFLFKEPDPVFTAADTVTQGDTKDYTCTPPNPGKYVLILDGTATAAVGVYEGEPVGVNGRFRVCGAGARGTRMLSALPHTIRVIANSTGLVSLKLRPWWLWDYFTIGRHKSSC